MIDDAKSATDSLGLSRLTQAVGYASTLASTMKAPALRMLSPAERALPIELQVKVAVGKGGKREGLGTIA